MIAVLSLFVIPIGGGIPAGVLLAQARGMPWTTTSALYLASDLLLAAVFEPLMLLFIAASRKSPFLARLGWAFSESTRRLTAHYRGSGPLALIMVAFGVDPMTGRSAAKAAGHGFVSGWAIAITGDMFYFWVVMASTLKLSTWLGSPMMAMWAVLAAMLLAPIAIGRLRKAFLRGGRAGRPL